MNELDEFAGVADLLPDGAMPLHSIRIVEFLHDDGTPGLKFKVDGDVNISGTVGILAMVQHAYIRDSEEDDE